MTAHNHDSAHAHDALVHQAERSLPTPEALEDAVVLFEALSEPSRVLILMGLRDQKELCVCGVAALLDVSVASASHHLRKMKDVGILKRRHDGKMAYYSIQDARVETLLAAAFSQPR